MAAVTSNNGSATLHCRSGAKPNIVMSILTSDVGCASIRLHLIACESVMLLAFN
jgi:hypothetical protein